ncbi:MAG: type II toxin-antitoxin system HicB family antitoxin [Gemmatimonadaceae bacterium]|nr:type II toxin-antitoxin system HicB family antitoxin [Gemmatimonadaceae bacterium]
MPDLPGAMADGATPAAAAAMAQEVIAAWIETARDEGWPIPDPTRRQVA